MARLAVDPAFVVGALDRRLFGSFVEHMGRCVYTGIYEPGHASADPDGFRQDVLDLVRELGVTAVRYPGGNFVSNYDWEDGVGPKEGRPRKLDLAWRAIEPNQFGTDEFVAWSRKAGVEPIWAVNLGTRGIREAVELLEYCNLPGGTELPDRRVANGATEPHAIKVWCLGNEMDGPWQIGHKTAEEYARLAEETANAMRRVDPGIEFVACGSSNRHMPTFADWERTVLERTYDLVDHISLHAYYEPMGGDQASFLAAAEEMDRFISSVVATADHVKALKRSDKEITLSFDEWNVWYQQRFPGELGLDIREVSPLIEDTYTVDDAVVVGSLLITLLRHADRVKIACLAQLVNVIGPIRTDPGGSAWRQTIFHPFALTAKHAGSTVLRTEITGPDVDTAAYGRVPALWSTATYEEGTGEVVIFVVNRSETDKVDLEVPVQPGLQVIEHVALYDDDRSAVNTAEDPDRVVPRGIDGTEVTNDICTATLPPASWHMIRLSPGGTR
ncbi:alpha-N-arabinofuranosidase [Kribbella sp. VKM Ac-2568]|uniref:arabinosylfuranosidase ArfA n=1 Tax=Kribbella sp. VKM Ac-2568 TaxID=2512219 RepID=UPI00104E842E|nr:alpha-N-arabinofuranosidase [Kribbella sp. VKM Ac-2568]TCM45692.1 alpha-N-arabinofuranosidase [Kribbella sp. VKM Ac-2568]